MLSSQVHASTVGESSLNALIDADILCYSSAFAGESYWRQLHDDLNIPIESSPPWEVVENHLHNTVRDIQNTLDAEKVYMALTGTGNFRNYIAKTQAYKQRTAEKPYHYKNIRAYIQSEWPTLVVDGLEADDLLGIAMTEFPNKYICCSVDKDLRQIPGMQYSWEHFLSPSFGPELVDEIGWIKLNDKRNKIVGVGSKFFYSQILTGDVVDDVPGIPKYGPVKAFNTLEPYNTIDELEQAVREAYRGFYGDAGDERMIETGRLVYMSRERNENLVKLYTPSFVGAQYWIDFKTGEIIES